ncbi:MAG: isoprenyl transferase [Lentimicrobiaceae bacterium]|jgi:undecaprenyl diphosphate synthase|nr:isoprenyl transferase [Lentimicrobiaceae bacterium]MCP4909959.1 isoprenyl transferase [Bacteroidota bacterium]MBT3454902.1 isoprenyl transferase [Lentimicrobiaceae bacterium]MBT3818472.1 isoprenyl transferase [Lentimicrobiaceae bacterium]MBT4060840.1 isoprenyl transferase [Lentimicrobiaceae bacterium]
MKSNKDKIDINKLPEHIAIIMDGNGRWAIKNGLDRVNGHHEGVDSVREVAEAAAELGIKYLTLYTFSTENWNRPKAEVDALMTLFVDTIIKELSTLNKNKIRLNAIGDLKALPGENYEKLAETMEKTKDNDKMVLTLAISYSSRWEILNAVKSISEKVEKKELKIGDIDDEVFNTFLSTFPMPDPELLIRTSGEHRISNYLLWQIAYSELYFTDVLWPDFRKEELYNAIVQYQNRERRFGMTSDQLQS